MEEKEMVKKPEENSEWTKVTKLLASEIIAGNRRESKAKSFAICLATAIIIISIGSTVVNYRNDREWRELITSYNYASEKVLVNQKVGE